MTTLEAARIIREGNNGGMFKKKAKTKKVKGEELRIKK
jgi:hypothetical protein